MLVVVEPELVEIARRQHGLLALAQLTAPHEVDRARRRLASGEWVEQQPRVFRSALVHADFSVRVMAVRLALSDAPVGSWCFSHLTAARLLGLVVPQRDRLDILLPTSRRKLRLRDVERHFTERRLRVIRVDGAPVPFVPMTILQSASVLPRDDLLHLVETTVRSGRTDLDLLRVVCVRGRSGAAALREAVAELSAEGLDRWVRRFVRLLVAAGLPRPKLEVPVRDGRRARAYLDAYWEEAGLALEVDDWETHGSREAQERDRRRDRWLLTTYGVVTVRVTPREIRDRPETVVADVCRAYRRSTSRSTEPKLAVTRNDPELRDS